MRKKDPECCEGRDVELKASVFSVVKYCHSPVYFSPFFAIFVFLFILEGRL